MSHPEVLKGFAVTFIGKEEQCLEDKFEVKQKTRQDKSLFHCSFFLQV